MILTCPNCEVRFLIDPGVLGENGRKLCCSSCSHQWFQVPDRSDSDDSSDSAQENGTDIPHFLNESENHDADNELISDSALDSAQETQEQGEIPPSSKNDDFETKLANQEKNQTDKNPKQIIAIFSGYVGAVTLYLVFILALILSRETITNIWQPSNLLFQTLGFESALNNAQSSPTELSKAFAIFDEQGSSSHDDKIKTLKIGWQSLNRSNYDISIKNAEIKLLDSDGKIFDIRELPVQENRIVPNSKPQFEYNIQGIHQDIIKSVRVEIKGIIL